jgi:uncharacterized iron-regulated protein
MNTRLLAVLAALTLTLTGCAAMTSDTSALTAPQTLYQAVIVDPADGARLSPEQLADRLAGSRVVVVGEYHGHPASHLLQSRLQLALYQRQPHQILSMEQFERDHQADLDRYLAGELGEAEMIEDTGAWDNYRGSYRALVEFARQHRLPVVAANAPGALVRCVGRQGREALARMPAAERAWLARQPFLDTDAYQDKFADAIGGSHGTDDASMSERMRNAYLAQLLRDNTMAESILDALARHPGDQVLHTTGTFHSEQRLGTVAVLLQRAPDLDVTVISPVFWPTDVDDPPLPGNRDKGDYLYFIQPLPPEYQDPERAREAMRARFSGAGTGRCP